MFGGSGVSESSFRVVFGWRVHKKSMFVLAGSLLVVCLLLVLPRGHHPSHLNEFAKLVELESVESDAWCNVVPVRSVSVFSADNIGLLTQQLRKTWTAVGDVADGGSIVSPNSEGDVFVSPDGQRTVTVCVKSAQVVCVFTRNDAFARWLYRNRLVPNWDGDRTVGGLP